MYLPLALSVHLSVPATILFSLRPNASQVVFSTQISKVHKSLRGGRKREGRGGRWGAEDEADLRLNESAPGSFLCAEKKTLQCAASGSNLRVAFAL